MAVMSNKKTKTFVLSCILVVLILIVLLLSLMFCLDTSVDDFVLGFVVDNALYEEVQAEEWEEGSITDPSKVGYDFEGWFVDNTLENEWDLDTGSLSGDTTLYAKWEAITYSITYVLDGGTNSASNPSSYTIESEAITLQAPTKEGYTFTGWTEGDTIAAGSTGNKTFTANWEIVVYTATFMNGGTTVAEVEFTIEDTSISEPALESVAGYEASWSAYTLSASDVTIEATYTILYYTAKFMNGDVVIEEVTFTVLDDSITEPEVPSLDGAVSSWASYELGTQDITILVVYVYVYTVLYEENGGSEIAKSTFLDGKELTTIAETTREGYTFSGWYLDKALTEVCSLPLVIDDSITIYASWTAVSYGITYNLEGGTNSEENPASYTIEDSITLESPTLDGYSFIGWYDTNGNKVTEIAVGAMGEIELTASWAEIKTVNWVINGTIVSTTTYVDGDSIPSADECLQTPVKEATAEYTYAFDGWSTTTLDDDDTIVYEAKFTETKNSYSVNFYDINGAEITAFATSIEYGSKVAEPTADEVYGYTFVAWYSDANLTTTYDFDTKTITSATSIYAKYTLVTYYVKFIDGTATTSVGYTIKDTDITEPDITEKTGYTAEWPEYSIDTTDLKDIEVTAVYTAITYTATFVDGDTKSYIDYTIKTETFTAPSLIGATGYTCAWDKEFAFVADDQEITAEYTAITYYVYFYADEALVDTEEYTVEDTDITEPTATAKTGYTVAWSSYSIDIENPKDITVNAVYTAITYTIAYDANGGSGSTMASDNATYDQDITLSTCTYTNSGYNFSGWATSASGTVEYADSAEVSNLTSTADETVTLYAVWVNAASVTFISNNGVAYDNISNATSIDEIDGDISEDGTVSALEMSSLANYTNGYYLDGWYTTNSFTTLFDFDEEIVSDTYIYAKWVESFEFSTSTISNAASSLSINNASSTIVYTITGIGTISGTEIVVPDAFYGVSITGIAASAFANNTNITSLYIADSVTSIGKSALSGCSNLASLTIPFVGNTLNGTSYTYFGYIFGDSSYLSSATATTNVPTSLKSLTVLGGTIANYAARYMSNIETLTIGDNVTSLGYYAFGYCTALTDVYYNAVSASNISSYSSSPFRYSGSSSSGCSLIIGDGVTYLPNYMFYYFDNLVNVTVGTGVESMGASVFGSTSNLSSIIFNAENCADVQSSTSYATFRAGTSSITITFGDSVTHIPSYLCYAISITSVTLPESVTSVGDNAFYNCTSLKTVTLTDSVYSLGDGAFRGCSSLASIDISNITVIGEHAFNNCSSLKTVTFSSTITTIAASSFYESGLTSLNIPLNITSIGSSAFYNMKGIVSLVIPDSIVSIGDYAFRNCSSLTEVYLPDSIEYLGYYAFANIEIDKACYAGTLEQWMAITFMSEYSSPMFYAASYYMYNDSGVYELITEITIPTSYAEIGDYTFAGFAHVTSVTFHEGITSIGTYAFYNCTGLTSIDLPNSLINIGDRAFGGGNSTIMNLTSITIPDSVITIGEYAFLNNIYASTVIIGSNVESIGDYAFGMHKNLSGSTYGYKTMSYTSIVIPVSVKTLGSYVFYYVSSGTTSLKIYCEAVTAPLSWASNWNYRTTSDSHTSITWEYNKQTEGDYTYVVSNGSAYITAYIGSGTDVVVPATLGGYPVVYIGTIFYENTTIETVSLPSTITALDSYAFYGCTSLESITISDGVTSIGSYAFYGCSLLESITIPDGVTSIGDYAFYGCSLLKSITIPSGVTSIADGTFYGCSSLESVTILGNITSIGGYAFFLCEVLETITMPNTVTSIGSYAFAHCYKLAAIDISNVEYIGYWAFVNCNALITIDIDTTATWYYTSSSSYAGGTEIEDFAGNEATYLVTTYRQYYLYRV